MPNLPPLATLDDLSARLGREIGGDELDRAAALLDDASAAVRGVVGQNFERGIVTQTFWPTCQGIITITGQNVADVTSTSPLTQVGRSRWRVGNTANWSSTYSSSTPRAVEVTYTSGWDEVPADIVAVVCSMVLRAFSIDPGSAGLQQESAGPFSVSYGAASSQGGIGMLAGELAVLARYTGARRIGTRRLSSWVDA